ncbi:MAG: hypothetical protein AB7V43_23185 [Acidimicrobiia bacterium]
MSERRFLTGPQSRRYELWHGMKLFREYWDGLRALHFVGPCITVFGSARIGDGEPEYDMARRAGALLAESGFTVMTGGGPASWRRQTAGLATRAVVRSVATSCCPSSSTPTRISIRW